MYPSISGICTFFVGYCDRAVGPAGILRDMDRAVGLAAGSKRTGGICGPEILLEP
jgi:hypothetical protein